MPSFARELDQLIRKHTATAQYGDDLEPIATTLHKAADLLDAQADRLRWTDESDDQFSARQRWACGATTAVAGLTASGRSSAGSRIIWS